MAWWINLYLNDTTSIAKWTGEVNKNVKNKKGLGGREQGAKSKGEGAESEEKGAKRRAHKKREK
jgi:hypothetical protein